MRIAAAITVGLVHVSVAVGLYAARVKHLFGGDDFIVFYLPAFMAAVAYYLVLSWRRSVGALSAVAAFALAAVSFFAAMLVNLNVYGS
ncbi:MAG: hypothetical protein M3037_14630 [Gemmatimonadota bacterium]|nr:hypothetical protein [Gemmatimonadota bacterium]